MRNVRGVGVGVFLSQVLASSVWAAEPAKTPTPTAIESLAVRLREKALNDPRASERLGDLCDLVGARLAGSKRYDAGVAWAKEALGQDGLDRVWSEPVTVRGWERGHERLTVVAPFVRAVPMLGLGMSVGTASTEAPLVAVHSLDEIGPAVKGKVVLFVPSFSPEAGAGARYGVFSRLRVRGASVAAGFGAVAVLVRAAPLTSLATLHTGVVTYDPDKPRIPAASVSVEDGGWMARLLERGIEVRVRLEMEARDLGDVPTENVLAEITGSEHPEEIVLVGAHLDSWDVGQGAQDDGVGVIHVIESLRLIHELGVRPKRTIRAVLFANEEHGTDGGTAYATRHTGEHHLVAIESDSGAGALRAWGAKGTRAQITWILEAAQPTGVPVQIGGGGTDIQPLAPQGVLMVGPQVDVSRYFDVHHTQADTIESVDPQLLRSGVAAIAVLTWQLANLPQ